jgi:predicted Zn-dependent protease
MPRPPRPLQSPSAPRIGRGVALVGATLLAACATHPAAPPTGPGPSPAEVGIGERGFPQARQTAGGDFTALPELSAYVAGVGRKVAAASDHPGLPYDFVIIDNPVPNAWALPGGKVGIHRGLLTALDSEAELAAVLAHEAAHAATGRDARRMERDLWFRLGSTGVAAATAGGRRDLVVGDARLGAVLAQTVYTPDEEIAADGAAMRALAKAGYDPGAAVAWQEALLGFADAGAPIWRSGLLATEPPSEARLAAARAVLATLPAGGTTGAAEYGAAVAPLQAMAPAFERLGEGERALIRGDAEGALTAARDAVARAPEEASFHLLEGRALLALDRPEDARAALDEAVRRGSGRFLPWLVRGEARRAAGDDAGARDDLMRSMALLPTDTAHLQLGRIDLAEDRAAEGKRHLRAAQEAGGPAGTRAGEVLARMELLDVPGRYVAVGVGLTPEGYMFFTVENRAPLPVRDVKVRVTLVDPATGAPREAEFTFDGPFGPKERVRRETHFGPFGPEVTRSVRTDVVAARLAE